MTYQQTIHEIDPDVNPAGVEANMRLQYGTLDHLPRSVFEEEAQIARACEQAEPGYLKQAAESYGMQTDFEHWENERARQENTVKHGETR